MGSFPIGYSFLVPQVTFDTIRDPTADDAFTPQATSSQRPPTESADTHPLASAGTTMPTDLSTGDTSAISNTSATSSELSLRNIVVHRSPPSRPPPPRPSAVTQGAADTADEPMTKKPARPLCADRSNSVVFTSSVMCKRAVGVDTGAEERRKSKMAETRSVTLTELLQTEKDYLADSKVGLKAFEKGLASRNEDIIKLIGNLLEIISINASLNASLERAIRENDAHATVASSFLSIAPSMSKAYCVYCKNAEDVPLLWMKLTGNQDLLTKKLISKANETIQNEANCMDVPSLLIKPAQRVLKYPLLLSELSKVASC